LNSDFVYIINENEVEILTNKIYQKYGYDFSDYSYTSFKRRIDRIISNYRILSFEKLIDKVINDQMFFNTFLEEITVNVTEMFRDPDFYKMLRMVVIPDLATNPIIRIWHAACSSGEEVYSMAILLKEAGVLEKSLLYATDINQQVLESAKSAKFSLDNMSAFNQNYLNSGGLNNLSDYYSTKSGKAIFHDEFKNRMVFSPHNLGIDQSFNEFNLILCRNVLIYFNRNLQERVVKLLSNSLIDKGYLALGLKESIDFTNSKNDFELISKNEKIWRKKE
jgi:chemotaxis protein methyltransferase CheR